MSAKYIIGIDLGGTNLKIALLDFKYRIIEKMVLKTGSFKDKDRLIQAIVNSLTSLLEANNLSHGDVLGLGIGFPGPIDNKRGIVHFLPNVPGWREVNLKKTLENKIRLPVFLDNDAKLMACAEYKLGRARGFENVLCLTLGTGVGGGLILGGKLYRGKDNAAGEIGHMPINENGGRCNCGGIACLETYIGNKTILKEARRLLKRDISLEELSAMAKKHHQPALRIWQEVGRRSGVALTGVVNLLNLDAIVVGGGIANAGAFLLARVRKAIKHQAMGVQAKRVKVFGASLGSNAGLIGAAIMVKEQRQR